MPKITPSDALSGALRGAGMQVRFDEDMLRQLRSLQPGDSFSLDYVVGIDGFGGAIATLQIGLKDPHDLFTGYTVIDVLANLLTQMVEARLL